MALRLRASAEFGSQHPHGRSQLSVTPVSGYLIQSSGFYGHQAQIQLYMCVGKHTHKIIIKFK